MLLNATTSQTINITLYKKIDCAPISVNDTEIKDLSAVKLLGVKFDSHIKFTNHFDSMIDKAKPAVHATIQLKKIGVTSISLISHLYYQS